MEGSGTDSEPEFLEFLKAHGLETFFRHMKGPRRDCICIWLRNVCDVPVNQIWCSSMSRHINMSSVSNSTRGNVSHGTVTDLTDMPHEKILKQHTV